MNYTDLFLTLPFVIMVTASPGPANLAIASTAMSSGRNSAFLLAAGITTASLTWSVSSALGLATLLAWQSWILQAVQIIGAIYLAYLAYRCISTAINQNNTTANNKTKTGGFQKIAGKKAYMTGLMIHISNPKAVLFFTSFYTLILTLGATSQDLPWVVAFLACQSVCVFFGYAWLFSSKPLVQIYRKAERGFNFIIGIAFIIAAVSLLIADL